MQGKVGQLLARLDAAGENVLLTAGRRTAAEQTHTWEQGRLRPGPVVTDARGDESFHVWGVAIDLVPVTRLGQPRYGDAGRYRAIARTARLLGFEWGPDIWDKDAPHFQYTQGLTIADFRKGKRLTPPDDSPAPVTAEDERRESRLVKRLVGYVKEMLARRIERRAARGA